MRTTKIEWTDKTWNPITGCTKKSAGCAHCYAEVMARRLKAMGLEKYRNGFELTLHEEDLEEPLQWRKPHNIFLVPGWFRKTCGWVLPWNAKRPKPASII